MIAVKEEKFTIDLPVYYECHLPDLLEGPCNHLIRVRTPRSTAGSFSYDKFTSTGAFLNVMPS